MSKRILHVCSLDKFIPPFIGFVEDNFGLKEHYFWLYGDVERYPVSQCNSTYKVRQSSIGKFIGFIHLIVLMNTSRKIILHGLFDPKRTILLFFMPWLLKKCYWVIWGGDLYAYKSLDKGWKWKVKEFFRRPVIKNIGNLITYIPGDVEIARKWYGAKGHYHECIMYLSNVALPSADLIGRNFNVKKIPTLNILVGNSASPTNNHMETFKMLFPYKDSNIKIFVPLSYGDQKYAEEVISYGRRKFGAAFVPLTDFMKIEDYLEFLSTIEVAIFNHDRQQGMGNTITLLGMGKKVFMRSGLSHFDLLKNLGLHLYDVKQFTIGTLESNLALENVGITSSYFSKDNLKKQLSNIIGE